jgi:hypothetical protein
VWPVEMGGWTATYPPISTSISAPWLARPERARGGTGGGTGAKARCSPLLAATSEVRGGQMCAEFIAGRGDVTACRCCELERVPADGSGRRPMPPADAHESWWAGVPGRERPPFCGAWVAPPPSRGSLTPRLSVSVLPVESAGDGRVVATCHPARHAPCICCAMSRRSPVRNPSSASVHEVCYAVDQTTHARQANGPVHHAT